MTRSPVEPRCLVLNMKVRTSRPHRSVSFEHSVTYGYLIPSASVPRRQNQVAWKARTD